MLMRFCRWILGCAYRVLGKELTAEQWSVWEQFIKFGLVGCSNSLVCLCVYYLVIWLGGTEYYLLGQTVGYIAAVFNSFFLNGRYVFSNYKGKKRIAFVKMCACNVIVYTLQMAVLYLLVDVIDLSEWIAPALAIVIALPVNFLLNKFYAFR